MDSMRKLAIIDYLEREREREEEEEMEEEEMEEEVMHKLAMIYYAKMSNDQKQSILSLFKKIDANGDGKVNVQEFFGMFIPGGNEDLEELFMFLDKNGDGTLDFEECVTFFYMIISNRLVWCDGCGSLLGGVYFLCVECYNVNREKTYDLCCSCYSDNNFSHAHAYFLDNYALLREKEIKNYTPGQAGSTRSNIPSARNYTRGQAGSARSKLGKIVDLADTLSNYEDMEGLVDTMAGLAHTTLSKSGSTSQGSKHEKIKDGVQSFLTGYRIASIASHAPAAAHVATHAFAACAIM